MVWIKSHRDLLNAFCIGFFLTCTHVPEFVRAETHSADLFAICDDPGAPQIYNQTDAVKSTPGFIKIWKYDSETEEVFDLPFAGHSITQNPLKAQEIAVFSLWGTQAAILNLKDKTKLRVFSIEKDHRFFGHGVYSRDAKILYTSESNDLTHSGEIVARDASTFKVISRFSVKGRYAYQVELNKNNQLVVAVAAAFKDSNFSKIDEPNFSEESSLTFLEAKTGKFIKRIKLGNENLFMHFETSADGWTTGVGQANDRDTSEKNSYTVSISPTGKTNELKLPDDFKGYFYGETIGIALLEKKSLAVLTDRSTKLIMMWNYKNFDLTKYFYIPDRPKAISMTSDNKILIVAETKTKSFLLIDTKTMEITGRAKGHELSGYGAHMIRLKAY